MIKLTKSINSINGLAPHVEDANVFFESNYASYCTDGEFVYLYSEFRIIPLVLYKKLLFKWCRLVSEPFQYKQGQETEKEFLNAVCDYLRKEQGVQWIPITPATSFFADYPDDSIFVPFGSHVIDLSLDEDTLFSKIHSKHRNVIKKAEKEGVVIEKGVNSKLIADYHSIDIQTWQRSNRSATGEDSIKKTIDSLKDNVIIYMAYKDGEPQSGAIFFYNKAMCYYMHGANKNNPLTGSGNLLQWQAIKDMKSQGVKKYSFVGCRINEDEDSKYHGIQRFKERFGGDLIQGVLFKVVFSPLLFRLFNAFLGLSSLLKTGHVVKRHPDIIDEEIHKWQQ